MKNKNNTKYVFVLGGVLSGVGKGITGSSIGAILQAKGLKVSMQKCDPYLNVDAGLLNPVEHGECFVTNDGVETDLDLGHYERFLDFETNKYSITLSGAIYKELIERERAGKFGGKTVQLVPHFTGLVQEKIERAGEGSDIHIVEIGGTVGDYESLGFLEAIRTFANKVGRKNCLFVSVVFVPYINTSKEYKSKPAQNALKDLRGFGIIPDVVVVRTESNCGKEILNKVALFSGISEDAVVNLPDVDSVYDVPLNVLKSGVLNILNDFAGDDTKPNMRKWEELSEKRARKYDKTVKVGLVAKYVGNDDTYMCVTEALRAAAFESEVNLEIVWINAENATKNEFARVDGIVVPGGFGKRGVEGKIAAADYALAEDKPYLGLCLGMQVAVIAAARRGGMKNANSSEFGAGDGEDVVYIMEGQTGKESTGASMRLGNYCAKIKENSLVGKIYAKNGEEAKKGEVLVTERHRHRYEVNEKFINFIEKGGLEVVGKSPDGKLIEFVEAPNCTFFVGTQAHPELKSRPMRVHPLFSAFFKSFVVKK